MADKLRKEKPSEAAARKAKTTQAKLNEEAVPEAVALHWSEYGHDLDFLPDLASKVRELQAEIAERETEKKELLAVIEASLEAVNAKSVKGDNWVAVKVAGGVSKSLSSELLLEQGVTLEQLSAATVEKPRKGYTQVRGLEVAE